MEPIDDFLIFLITLFIILWAVFGILLILEQTLICIIIGSALLTLWILCFFKLIRHTFEN